MASLEVCSVAARRTSPVLPSIELGFCPASTSPPDRPTTGQRAGAAFEIAASASFITFTSLARRVLSVEWLQFGLPTLVLVVAVSFVLVQIILALRRRIPWWIWRSQALDAMEKEFETLCDSRQSVVYSYYWSLDRDDAEDVLKHYYSEIKAYDCSLEMLRKNYNFLKSASYARGSVVPKLIRRSASLLADMDDCSSWWNIGGWKEHFSSCSTGSSTIRNQRRRSFRLSTSGVSISFLLEYAQHQDLAAAVEAGQLQEPQGDDQERNVHKATVRRGDATWACSSAFRRHQATASSDSKSISSYRASASLCSSSISSEASEAAITSSFHEYGSNSSKTSSAHIDSDPDCDVTT